MTTDRQQLLLTAPILPTLLGLATPQALGFLVQSSVSIAEIYFIGQLGTTSLAAMALVFPLMMLVQMISGGAIGGSVTGAIARTLGSGNMARAEALLWHVIYIAFLLGLVVTLIYLAAGEAILGLLGGKDEVLEQALIYIAIFFPGSILIWLSNMMLGVVRGTGNMKLPAMLMIVTASIQVPLSGALILGFGPIPAIGLAGAAVSILTVNLINVGVLTYLHATGYLKIRFNPAHLAPRVEFFTGILSTGAVAAIAPFFTVFMILFVTALVGRFGTEALAGYGIASRIEFLITPMVFGLGVAMNTMAGSCIGAGDYDRAERVGWTGSLCAGAVTGSVGLILAFFPEFWIQIFSEDPATLAVASRYFEVTGPFFGFFGIGLSLFFASQGAGAVGWPVVATAVRFSISVGGSWYFASQAGAKPEHLFICIGVGMLCYCLGTTAALYLGSWRRGNA